MRSAQTTPNQLVDLSQKFFERHWHAIGPQPVWLKLDPEHIPEDIDAGGCYAVADPADRMLYVGLALAERPTNKPLARGGVIRRLFRHVIRRGALTKGQFLPKREVWSEQGGIGSIWVILFPDRYSYLAAGLEVFLIQELSGKLPVNKSRVRSALADAAD